MLRATVKGLVYITLVLILAITCILSLTIREVLFEAYARPKIWLNSHSRPWLTFGIEDKLYVGLHDLTKRYRNVSHRESPTIGFSPPFIYAPTSAKGEERARYGFVPCDGVREAETNSTALGYLKAFNGSLSRFPTPAIGSYGVLGLDSAAFFTRSSRFSEYGLSEDDDSGASSSLKFDDVDWANLQGECVARNQARFDLQPRNASLASLDKANPHQMSRRGKRSSSLPRSPSSDTSKRTRPRTAVVLRAWDGFQWTEDAVRNVRAMITELSLFSGGEYQLYIMVQIHDQSDPLHAYRANQEDIKRRYVPKELLNMTELWNETDSQVAYPKVKEYGVYYQAFMPLQLFAIKHPEFDFYWNWEMDIRYTGHYYQLLESLSTWAKNQTRNYLWDRNARFYIPSVYGSYDEFAKRVQMSTEDPPWGPMQPAESFTRSPSSPVESPRRSPADWGVGEEADLITLFPMFDPKNTIWPWRNHLVNYDTKAATKPRRATVITAMRLSHRLLMTMHDENSNIGRSMQSEMWPVTTALHHGLKAVYAPHPMFLDRRWPPEELERIFNAGPHGQVGGSPNTVLNQEHTFHGATWFWNARFPGDLYIRWMGKASDGAGSPEWEKKHGPMCLPGILLHPVKKTEPDI